MGVFEGKVAFVTGAGQGIGYEISRQFYQQGGIVYLNDIEEKLCVDAALKIGQKGDRCFALPGDASDVSYIKKALNKIVSQHNKLDIIIANAGITVFKKFFDFSEKDLDKITGLNIKGTFFLIQEAARIMKELKKPGKLIIMSSVTGHRAHADLAAYGMTKAAIESLVRNLVIELSPLGININAIAPGATLTERTIREGDYVQIWSKLTPTGRPSTPEDIAHLALFLASKKADQISGQTYIIDGGWTATSPGPEMIKPD